MFFQHEKGTHDHYQGAIWFSNPRALAGVVKALGGNGIHVEPAKASPEKNRDYCSKSESKVAGPWELGAMPKQGKRADLVKVADSIRKRGYEETYLRYPQVTMKYPTGLKEYEFITRKKARLNKGYVKPRIWVLWGAPDSGKSRWAAESSDSVYFKEPIADKWWQGYHGQDRIVLDDFYGQIPYHDILRLIDGYAQTRHREIKGGFTILSNTEWVFTSNSDPRQWYANVPDREALWNRLWHRFESIVWCTDDNTQTPCPCSKCGPVWVHPSDGTNVPGLRADTFGTSYQFPCKWCDKLFTTTDVSDRFCDLNCQACFNVNPGGSHSIPPRLS